MMLLSVYVGQVEITTAAYPGLITVCGPDLWFFIVIKLVFLLLLPEWKVKYQIKAIDTKNINEPVLS